MRGVMERDSLEERLCEEELGPEEKGERDGMSLEMSWRPGKVRCPGWLGWLP